MTKIRCGNRENDKYLVGIRDLTAPREAEFAKIWARDAGFFRLFVENLGNRHDPNKRPILAAKTLVSPFKPNYSVCLVNIYLIETVREHFVSTRCHKRPCGVIAYQLLSPCSIDSVPQSLQSFIFIVLRGVFFNGLNARWPWIW